ncbi:hypothetical protein BDB01DRAFT_754573 [Pilobolus umbonatus]|nr:hypothetical protein BDB01DRAFT_754573 [Pilobolus umbonatus]
MVDQPHKLMGFLILLFACLCYNMEKDSADYEQVYGDGNPYISLKTTNSKSLTQRQARMTLISCQWHYQFDLILIFQQEFIKRSRH